MAAVARRAVMAAALNVRFVLEVEMRRCASRPSFFCFRLTARLEFQARFGAPPERVSQPSRLSHGPRSNSFVSSSQRVPADLCHGVRATLLVTGLMNLSGFFLDAQMLT